MGREEWINYYNTYGLKGDIYVTHENGIWLSKFLVLNDVPVYRLLESDIQKLHSTNYNKVSIIEEDDKYLKEKYSDNLRSSSISILIHDDFKILKKMNSDKYILLSSEIKFGFDVDIRRFRKSRLLISGINVQKNKLVETIAEGLYDYSGEIGLFFDDDYRVDINTKLTYFNLTNLVNILGRLK